MVYNSPLEYTKEYLIRGTSWKDHAPTHHQQVALKQRSFSNYHSQ